MMEILRNAVFYISSEPLVFSLAAFGYLLLGIFMFITLKQQGFFKNSALAQAQRQIQEQEKWMKFMQEHMTDGLAVYSNRGDLLYINPAALQFFNISQRRASGARDLLLGQHFSSEEIERFKHKVLESGETVTAKITLKGKHDSKVIEVRLSPVYGKFTNVIAIAASYRDITELQALERNKEEFIQVASHELRTPLTAIRGFMSLLQMDRYGRMSPKQKTLVENALFACSRLSKLVDNLLMVAKIEESRVDLNLEIVSIEELISITIQELAGEADRCAVTLRVLAPSRKLPDILADKEKLLHVLSNLLGNAIKYTPEGGHVFIEPKMRGEALEISVSDTGVGIASEDLARLFQKFERISNKRSVKVGGSGLGLVIVKSLIELHGGKVQVTSRVGQGSTFTVSLPAGQRAYA